LITIALAEIPVTLAMIQIGKSLNDFILIKNFELSEIFLNHYFLLSLALILFIILMTRIFKRFIIKKF